MFNNRGSEATPARFPDPSRRACKMSEERPVGQVTLSGELLEVEFRYSPERVAAIKKIPQSRFQAATKRWTVPARHYAALESSTLLGPTSLEYRFSVEHLRSTREELEKLRQSAEEILRLDPFSVTEESLAHLDLDLVVRLDARGTGLRAHTKFRSKAQALLERVPGAHYLRSEKCTFLPAVELNDLLIALRDERLRFAVSADASARLKSTAELRSRIKLQSSSPDAEELASALLVPFLDLLEDGEETFVLRGYTSEQLRRCFPSVRTFAARRALAAGFSRDELFGLLDRARVNDLAIWRTGAVARFLERAKTELSEQLAGERVIAEALVPMVGRELCWLAGTAESGAGLLVSRELLESRLEGKKWPLSKRARELLAQRTDAVFIRTAEHELLDLFEACAGFFSKLGGAEPGETEEFVALRARLAERQKLLDRRRAFQELVDSQLEDLAFSDPALPEKLFPHQRVAVSWLASTPRAFLGDDMGLGKTLSVLAAFDALATASASDFLLVICPSSLLRNWIREAERWLPARRLVLLPNDRKERLQTLKRIGWGGVKIDGLVLNYEAARLEHVWPELIKILESRRPLVCIDESQRVKNAASKTFEALSAVVRCAERRILLSGTPTPKDISDIWSQMHLLDDGERLGTNFYHWLGNVAELGNKYSEYAVKRFRPDAVKDTVARVHELLLRRRKEEVVRLPEKTFLVRDVELKGEQLKRYEEVRKDLLLRMSSVNGKTFIREINNILEEYLRAVQVASNPRLIDEAWKGEPAKFEELDGLIEELVAERDEKVVVWTNYLGNVRELTKRYAAYGALPFSGEISTAERDRTVQSFQQGDCRVLVAVPAAGGVGITLTAAQTAIYLEKTWNAEHWFQSVDRIHRIGQTGTVRIVSLQASKVDELIARNLERKGRDQARLLGDGEQREMLFPTRDELLEAVGK